MPRAIGWQEISSRIQRFVTEPSGVLFAGAGVGVRAGLLSWPQFMEHLAVVAEKYEPEIATLIRNRVRANRYAEAGHMFKQCQMPEGEIYRALAEPFQPGKYDARYLKPLVSLPFTAIVTTNYDKSLHDAWSAVHDKAPTAAELHDPTLSAATHQTEPFIARIHGRAEVPAYMVVDTDDYKRAASDEPYLEFLRHIFGRRRCMIVGFSFVDPAVSQVLEFLRKFFALGLQPVHLAFVPEGSDELAARLAELNIDTVLFESPSDDSDPFAALWGGISDAAHCLSARRAPPRAPSPLLPSSLEPARGLLASCYVRAKMRPHLPPLKDLVLQGIIVAILADACPEGLDRHELSQAVHRLLPLTVQEAEQVTAEPLAALLATATCHLTNGRITCGPVENRLERDIASLAEGALNRLNLRRGGKTSEHVKIVGEIGQLVREVLEDALLMRGWDLGAEFAGGSMPVQVDCWRLLNDTVQHKARTHPESLRLDIVASCFDLLRRPTDREAAILADIGRLAFGIDIVLQHGRSALLHPRVLPDRLYLDANVAMPAIVDGHPYRPTYLDILKRWRDASLAAGLQPELMLGDVFLNEIISHRERALDIAATQGFDDPEKLRKHVLFYGGEYTNVFIGAYATWVARDAENPPPFGPWLAEHAPYTSVDELRHYLAGQGIEAVELRVGREEEDTYREIRTALQTAYDEDERTRHNPKPAILITDEARQLATLIADLQAGQRTLFVSADRRLRRLAVGPVLGYVGGAIVSHVALFQLVDLLVGVEAEPRSVARFLWGVHYLDNEMALRNYFVDLALQRHEEAMVMPLPMIVEAVAAHAADQAERQQIRFWTRVPEDQARASRFLDQVEDQFFEAMSEAVAKFRREHGEP